MDKRLAKRHKRHVERKKEHVKLSEPDVRTPEQIKAAREASRPTMARPGEPNMPTNAPMAHGHKGASIGSTSKSDG